MFRSSTHRNSRCKDCKVKCVLQIFVFLGICVWIVYLVQDSREKRTSYVGEATKIGSEGLKFKRKDPRLDMNQYSTIDARNSKVEEDEEGNEHEKLNKIGNANVVDENLMQKNERNNSEKKHEHREDWVDKDMEESYLTNKEIEENGHKANKDNDDVIKENDENKNKEEESNQSRETNERNNVTNKVEIKETEMNNNDNENTNPNIIEVNIKKNDIEENKEESNITKKEREKNEDILEKLLSKARVKNEKKDKKNEKPRDELYVSNVLDSNKTKQSNKKENNGSEFEYQTNETKVRNFQKKDNVLNITQQKTKNMIDLIIITTNHKHDIKNQIEKKNNSKERFTIESNNKSTSSNEETLHSQNISSIRYNTTKKQFETTKNYNVNESNLYNTTLELRDSKLDVIMKQVDYVLTNSSITHESIKVGKINANDNGHDELANVSNSSILDKVRQVENQNIDIMKIEDEALES